MTWDPATWESDFVTAVAETLAAEGVAAYSPAAVYPTNGTLPAVFDSTLPAAGTNVPVLALSLTPYTVTDTSDEHVVQGLQVRSRAAGRPALVRDIDTAVWRVLHRPLGLMLGTTDPQWCASSRRQSRVPGFPLDPTGKAREAVSNYYLLLPRASVAPAS